MRRALKGIAERLLTESGLASLVRRRHAGRCLVLAFHNIVAAGQDPGGDRPLHLPADAFERFLDLLAATHEVVGLASIASPPHAGDRPRAVITFDDAYAGALRYGLPALAARKLPATIFVAPGLLGRPACWWDRLADPQHGLEEADRRHALGPLRGDDGAIMAWAASAGRATTAPREDFRIATEVELGAAARQPGVTIGAHTWSHCNLTAITGDEIAPELERPLAWLRARFPTARPWLAYPYGLSSPAVARAAERAGYAWGCEISGGWFTFDQNAWSVPRLNVAAGLSDRGFILRAAGVFR